MDTVKAFAVIISVGMVYYYYFVKGNRWFLLKFVLLFLVPVVGVIFLAKTVYSFSKCKVFFR